MACIISAPSSGSGKTLLSLLLSSWAKSEGKILQPFKIGPDYLDPQYLGFVSKRPCRNLDLLMSGSKWVIESFHNYGGLADASLIEGVMGLFDGLGSSREGSTAEIAKLLDLPIVLIIDARGQAASLAAIVKGFIDLDPEIKIAGVVLNHVRTTRHKELLKEVLNQIGVKLLGFLPEHQDLNIQSKNLGLQPAHEIKNLSAQIASWSSIAKAYLDLEAFRPLLTPPKKLKDSIFDRHNNKKNPCTKIAIAEDNAFHFQYPETKEYLDLAGFELLKWKPTEDEEIPKEAKGLIIPGGFPEEYAEQISASKRSINSIKSFYGKKPIYAECGGMLLLGEKLSNIHGKEFKMTGILPFIATQGDLKVGYREVKSNSKNLILEKGERLIGHEFHRWKLKESTKNYKIRKSNFKYPWKIKGWRGELEDEGWSNSFLHASWIHLHWASSPNIIRSWKAAIINNE